MSTCANKYVYVFKYICMYVCFSIFSTITECGKKQEKLQKLHDADRQTDDITKSCH